MNLSKIILSTKTAEVKFPGIDGFVVTISSISRELSRKIRDESEISKIDPKMKIPVKELDEDLFLSKFVSAAIKGWKGLKYKHLNQLLLVDLTGIDPEDELEYSLDDAIQLVKHSQVFDNWINEVVFNLDSFRDEQKGIDSGVSEKVSG